MKKSFFTLIAAVLVVVFPLVLLLSAFAAAISSFCETWAKTLAYAWERAFGGNFQIGETSAKEDEPRESRSI